MGAKLWDLGLAGKTVYGTDKLIVPVIQCTSSLPEMISESSEFEVGQWQWSHIEPGSKKVLYLLRLMTFTLDLPLTILLALATLTLLFPSLSC